ncbi:hypothetical protein HYPDE_28098 [Hyphomicrobium denitrificans 1NES1]|uniref:Uncharacterized protein n=1 Tax=Hyphomicrobium denitrificans 1NES1 TaxID=670307 RepID=N0B1D5_9HYPH|nr:hypothetical protein HYPDE_28098 [Hyphomicrobium denitrificans 1NES1]
MGGRFFLVDDAAADLHERVWGPVVNGVATGGGGPIASGTFGGMVARAIQMPRERWADLSISVDHHAAGGKTWLEFADIQEVFKRADFPK